MALNTDQSVTPSLPFTNTLFLLVFAKWQGIRATLRDALLYGQIRGPCSSKDPRLVFKKNLANYAKTGQTQNITLIILSALCRQLHPIIINYLITLSVVLIIFHSYHSFKFIISE